MNYAISFSIAAALALVLADPLKGDLRPQPAISFSKGESDSFNAEWEGILERTYFVEYSLDLQGWDYAPFMAFGVAPLGVHTYGGQSDAAAFFLRLKYTDVPTTNAELADYDLDGLGNLAELNLGTDPLDADTDHDGLNDGAEVASGGDPLSDTDGNALFAGDSDTDGLKDVAELALGTSPMLADSDGDGYDDGLDVFPLDPERYASGEVDPGDSTGPLVTIEAPANAIFISGP